MRRTLYIFSIIGILLAGGCQKSLDTAETDAIGFGSETEETKASLVTADSFKSDGKFVVYASYTPDNTNYASIMSGVEVTSTDEGANWSYTPLQYWHKTGEYDFRAYYPADTDIQTSFSSGRTLLLNVNSLTTQKDIMVAYRHRDMSQYTGSSNPKDVNGKYVLLDFQHAQAAVRVLFQKGSSSLTYKLEECYFTGLYVVGSFLYDSTSSDINSDWVPVYRAKDDGITTDVVFDYVPDDDAAKTIPAASADFTGYTYNLAIPQTLTPGTGEPDPAIHFALTVNGGKKVESSVSILKTDAPTSWEAGKVYTYVVTVKPNKADIKVITTKWDEISVISDDFNL